VAGETLPPSMFEKGMFYLSAKNIMRNGSVLPFSAGRFLLCSK